MLLPGEIQNKNRFLIVVFMKNKIANQPKLPVMEGEGKTGSGATANKMAVMAVVLKWRSVPNLVPRVLSLSRRPWGRGWECSVVQCLRRAVSRRKCYANSNLRPACIMAETFSRKWAEVFFTGKYAFVVTLQHYSTQGRAFQIGNIKDGLWTAGCGPRNI